MRFALAPILALLVVAGSTTFDSTANAVPSSDTPAAYCAVNTATPSDMVCADSPTRLTAARSTSLVVPLTLVLIARLYDNANYDTSAGYLEVYAAADCTVTTSDIDSSLSDLGA